MKKFRHIVRDFLIKSRSYYYNYILRKPNIYFFDEQKFQAYKKIGKRINFSISRLKPYFAIRNARGDMITKLQKTIKSFNDKLAKSE